MSGAAAPPRDAPIQASGPRAEYIRRLAERRAASARLERREASLSGARLAVAAAGAAVLYAWLAAGAVSAWWMAAPAAAFAGLAAAHERVIRARRRLDRAAAFYQRCLDRLDHRWAGRGEPGLRFIQPGHLFAADLDLFGEGSLFEMLCTARTRAGEEALATWLRAPAPGAEVRQRQEAVRELAPNLDLREDLASLGADVRAGVHPEELAGWAAGDVALRSAGHRLGAALLSTLTVTGAAIWLLGLAGPSPFLAAAAAQSIVAMKLRPRVRRVLASAESAARDLALLSQVLERLEKERFASARLAALRAALDTAGVPPSRRIASLHRLIRRLDQRRNQLFAALAAALLWATQIAYALERWRETSGSAVPRWLAAVGEIEALCSLAAHAYENPGHPFPDLADASSPAGPWLDAEAIGHPLIPEERCVRNDLALGGEAPAVLIVSGSNMSGKSTLLRTVGVNVILAMAGAPVRARRLRLSPMVVGASIRTQDSLQSGTSRFYAEITRLRDIVDLTRGPLPVLFLIDEMLHGTNSHDRRIGAEAVVKGLVERGAAGLVTTHDLALAGITEALGGRAASVHFEDHLEDGLMRFDYLMRPGIVRKSNALELMRSVGLDL
ncbi:MAG TPA: DNA mismatch repair protein MutS [Candidatus Polarisedimenticolia bacterium]|nr:DNA mismatch repair protein MutS [Candidatus Polarisedimenticolia bacterium]